MSLSPALWAIFPPTTEMRGTGGLRGRCLGFAYGVAFSCELDRFHLRFVYLQEYPNGDRIL